MIPQPRGADGSGDADIIVFRSEPAPGATLKTTLDQKVQNAADAALAGTPQRSALVAIRVSDGAILAAANGPSGPISTWRSARACHLVRPSRWSPLSACSTAVR